MGKRTRIVMFSGALLALSSVTGYAQTAGGMGSGDSPGADPSAATTPAAATLETLDSFVDLRNAILQDIKAVNQQIDASQSDAEKQGLKSQLDELQSDLRAITQNFENIAAGIDITSLRAAAAEEFNFQRELLALLKPALEEMKEMTSNVRQKSDLKKEIAYHKERLPVIKQAIANADPDLLALCPLHLSIYGKDGKTHVVMPRLSAIAEGSPGRDKVVELEAELKAIVEKALAADD